MMAILTDTTRCIGCNECVIACKEVHELPPDKPRRWQRTDGLSARNWTSVLRVSSDHFVRKQCRHCLEPACASACPVGALHTTPEGAVVYEDDMCMGCRYCMMACPFGIPRYEWDSTIPYVRKCILCYDRIQEGKKPACTEVCPQKATIFGDRAELLAEARRRLAAEPDKYIQHVWGEHEIGGTNVLYISDFNLDFLADNKKLDSSPLPERTRVAMQSVPFAFAGAGALMLGLNWIVERRNRLRGGTKSGEANDEPNQDS